MYVWDYKTGVFVWMFSHNIVSNAIDNSPTSYSITFPSLGIIKLSAVYKNVLPEMFTRLHFARTQWRHLPNDNKRRSPRPPGVILSFSWQRCSTLWPATSRALISNSGEVTSISSLSRSSRQRRSIALPIGGGLQLVLRADKAVRGRLTMLSDGLTFNLHNDV